MWLSMEGGAVLEERLLVPGIHTASRGHTRGFVTEKATLEVMTATLQLSTLSMCPSRLICQTFQGNP